MAELAVDQPRLLKTMRWWDGFIIGLANPGFLLAGLAGSVVTLGPKWAAIIWFSSAVVGALQAYVYAEPAAMFPDKSGGLSMYAKEGWRKHFSLAGPIATFGYWFAWSSVLAIYGGIIGTLLLSRFWPDTLADPLMFHLGFIDVTWPRVIGAVCIASCFLFNIRGMRPAVWFSYVTGAMMIIPVLALALIPLVNGDITSHALNVSFIEPSVLFYDESTATSASGFSQVAMIIVWFWVIAWSTYGPEAPATFAPEFVDTRNDTRWAIASTGALNVVLSLLLPLTIVGVLGVGFIAEDTTFIAYLTEALDRTVGETLGGLFVVFVCGGAAAVDEHRDDGRLARPLRHGQGGADVPAARPPERPQRAEPGDDGGHGAEPAACCSSHRRCCSRSSPATSATCCRTCSPCPGSCSCGATGPTGRARCGTARSGS